MYNKSWKNFFYCCRRRTECPNFPTYFPEEHEKDPLPEEEYHPKLFNFDDPTIEYEPEVAVKKKK